MLELRRGMWVVRTPDGALGIVTNVAPALGFVDVDLVHSDGHTTGHTRADIDDLRQATLAEIPESRRPTEAADIEAAERNGYVNDLGGV